MQTVTYRPQKLLLHFLFFLSGIATVLIGQVLPILSRKFSLSDLEAGYFFPSQFAGSLIGTFMTDMFGRKGKLGVAALLGSLLMAAGLLLINFDLYGFCLFGFFVNGLGVGLTLPAINILILEMNPANSAAALSKLNFFWGAGAIVSKPFVDLTAAPTSVLSPTSVISLSLLIGAALLFLSAKAPEATVVAAEQGDPKNIIPIWTLPLAWMIAAFNFIHVGFESGMGGWITTYSERIETTAAIGLISPTLLYFLFFVAGRGIAPVFFRYLNENQVLMGGLVLILLGLIITLAAGSVLSLSIGASVTGLGTSAIFPTNVSRFSRTFGAGAMRRAMPLFICGTIGSSVITWLIGYVSASTGNLRSGMAVLFFCILILIAVQIVIATRPTAVAVR